MTNGHQPESAIECLGAWFHHRLEAGRRALGMIEAPHADDPEHNRAVGAALMLAYTGRVGEALELYNRWAAACGYMPMKVVSMQPLMVDIGDGVLLLENFAFWLVDGLPTGADAAKRDAEISKRIRAVIHWDYARVFVETELCPKWAERRTREMEDQCPMPEGFEHLRITSSTIHGVGLFTDRPIAAGEVIGPARISGKRTPLGRYANHSPWANTEFRLLENGDLESVALCDMPAGAEILNNYRQGARLWGAEFRQDEQARTVIERLAMLISPMSRTAHTAPVQPNKVGDFVKQPRARGEREGRHEAHE